MNAQCLSLSQLRPQVGRCGLITNLIPTIHVSGKAAILHDQDTWWALELPSKPNNDLKYDRVLGSFYAALHRRNIPTDFVFAHRSGCFQKPRSARIRSRRPEGFKGQIRADSTFHKRRPRDAFINRERRCQRSLSNSAPRRWRRVNPMSPRCARSAWPW